MSRFGFRSRAMAGSAAALLVASAGFVSSTPASATPSFSFARVAGSDRFDTAKQVALKAFPNGADTALIATGFNFPDSLAGNYLAGQRSAPVLLVNVSAPVPQATLDALSGLRTKNVIILGLQNSVGADVEAQLAGTNSSNASGGKLNVSRIGGNDRYDTMKAIDETAGSTVGSYQGKKTAFLARGDKFPDALGAGPIADAKQFPVILTDPTTLSPQASAVIKDLGIQQLLVLGGTNSIPVSVEQAANTAGAATLQRFGGIDRSDTSRLLADYAIAHFAFADTGFSVASGDERYRGADALASGPFGAVNNIPTLVTNSSSDPGKDVTFASTHSQTEAQGYAIGGQVPLPDSTLAPIQAVARGQGTAPAGSFGGGGGSTPPTAANTGPYPNGLPPGVTDSNASNFTQNGFVYAYNTTDQYQLVISGACAASTYAQFQARLSTGDFVGGNYQPAGTSTFCLNDVAPAPPATVTASANDGTQPTANTSPGAKSGGVTVSFGDSSTPDVSSYTIYRAPATASPVPGGPASCPATGSAAPGASPQAAPGSPFVSVGSVPDGSPAAGGGTETYYFNDTSAATGTFCYAVSAIGPNAAGGSQIGNPQTANHDPTGQTSQPITGAPDQPHFTSLFQKASDTFIANYDQTINANSCDAPPVATTLDFVVTFTTASGTTTPSITSVTCDNSGLTATGGTDGQGAPAANLGEAIIKTSPGATPGTQVLVTAQKGFDTNTVCAAGTPPSSNCQAVGDHASTTTVAPTITSVTQSGPITAKALSVSYNVPVHCPTGAGVDFKISTDVGSSCAATTDPKTVIVTFSQPFTAGGPYDVTYTEPVTPSTANAVFGDVYFAPSQTVTGVTIA